MVMLYKEMGESIMYMVEVLIKILIEKRAKQLGYDKDNMPNRKDITDEVLLWLMNELTEVYYKKKR